MGGADDKGRKLSIIVDQRSTVFLHYAYWLRDKTIDHVKKVLLGALGAGRIPRHVAFIMDGNRRYACTKGMKAIEGHVDGSVALVKVLETCSTLGIKSVSVYAFATENFKRPKEEVDGLMNLGGKLISSHCTPEGIFSEHGVKINVVGRIQLLPPAVQSELAKAEELTKNNNRSVLNLCVAYSSRDEIATAVEETVRDALLDGRTEQITKKDIEDHVKIANINSPPLDILIRTSGVKRLSDYLLWQCTENTQIHFLDKCWPDMGAFDLLPIILDYQRKVWSQ